METGREFQELLVDTARYQRSHYFGKYRGKVVSVDGERGLVKALVPELLDDLETAWAVPAVPFAGKNHGLVLLPEVGDGVWIEFEAGDLDRPIWTGGWWASGEMPAPGGPETRVLVTSGGHKLILDDKGGKLQLLHSGGAELTMTDKDITLKIGSTQIVLSAAGVNINKGALEVK